jgi:hypothetical protein
MRNAKIVAEPKAPPVGCSIRVLYRDGAAGGSMGIPPSGERGHNPRLHVAVPWMEDDHRPVATY